MLTLHNRASMLESLNNQVLCHSQYSRTLASLFIAIKSRMMDSFYLVLLLTAQLLLDTVLVGAQNTNFSFLSFPTTDSFLMFEDIEHDATNSSFTMTPIKRSMYYGTCGKLFYKDPVRMKESASGAVASFHTSFTFAMYSPLIFEKELGWLYADGITFTFGRNSTFLGQDAGGTLCLLKQLNNGLASNRVLAVEFDSFQDIILNDTSNNHIGVNINSVNSTWSYNLCEGGEWKSNCTYFHNAGFFTAWIDYDIASQMLQVFLINGSSTTYKNHQTDQCFSSLSACSIVRPCRRLHVRRVYCLWSASQHPVLDVHKFWHA